MAKNKARLEVTVSRGAVECRPATATEAVSLSIDGQELLSTTLEAVNAPGSDTARLLDAAMLAGPGGVSIGQCSNLCGGDDRRRRHAIGEIKTRLADAVERLEDCGSVSTTSGALEDFRRSLTGPGAEWTIEFKIQGRVVLTVHHHASRGFLIHGRAVPNCANAGAARTAALTGPDKARAVSATHYRDGGWPEDETYLAFGPEQEVKRLLVDEGKRVVAVTGPGGVGKSALGRWAARELGEEFPYRFLLRAESLGLLRQALIDLAARLGLVGRAQASLAGEAEAGGQDREMRALHALRAWKPDADCLIVLDNLGDPTDGWQKEVADAATWESAYPLLPDDPGLRVLITCQAAPACRNQEREPCVVVLDLLTEDQAVDYLVTQAGFVGAGQDWRGLDPSRLDPAREVCRALSEVDLSTEEAKARVYPLSLEAVVSDVTAWPPENRPSRLAEWPTLLDDVFRHLDGSTDARTRPFGVQASLLAVLEKIGNQHRSLELLRAMAWLQAERVPAVVLAEALGIKTAGALDAAVQPLLRHKVVFEDGAWSDDPTVKGRTLGWHRSRRMVLQREQGGGPNSELFKRLVQAVVWQTPGPGLGGASENRRAVMAGHAAELASVGAPVDGAARATIDLWKRMAARINIRDADDGAWSEVAAWLSAREDWQVPWLDLARSGVADLSPLAGLTALQKLSLWYTQVEDLSPLAGLTGLTNLDLSGTQVEDLSPLAGLTALMRLDLGGTQVEDLSPLAGLTSLRVLDLQCPRVEDLSPLAGLTALRNLHLWDTRVEDLSPLAGLTALQELSLEGTEVEDLSPLAGLTALESLDLEDTRVKDLSPLKGLPKLRLVFLPDGRIRDPHTEPFPEL
jgi:hypothetical protein